MKAVHLIYNKETKQTNQKTKQNPGAKKIVKIILFSQQLESKIITDIKIWLIVEPQVALCLNWPGCQL